jgi:hypothetical protein
VVLELCCPVAVCPEHLAQYQNHEELCRLGEQLVYNQKIQRMAVHQDQLDTVRQELLTSFEANALPLIAHPDFAAGFIAKELRRHQNKNKRNFPAFHE